MSWLYTAWWWGAVRLLFEPAVPLYRSGMGKRLIPPEPSDVQAIALREALEERYLAYALSTIMHRALPDARDGLKPVHRRLLFAMRQLRLDPGQAFKKSARVVGDVIGKYHPHGDQSVYDALVRLAQDFAQRYPLVDGQGNFGNIDGDNPAAMRYTESRMTEVARLLLDGIDEDAVDFRPTYDGSESEPIVLPGAFPNLLANGSTGIAVGMATNIPPHNAARALRRRAVPDRQSERARQDAAEIHPGSGFSDRRHHRRHAGGDRRGLCHRPRLVPRPRALDKEETGRGTYQIVVTQIPWLVQKTRLIERMAELFNDKKLPLVAEFRDESTEDVRVVIEPKSRDGRCRTPDGVAVQADRAREPHLAQHERAVQGQGAQGDGPRRGPEGVARSPPRRAGAALQASARGNRPPPRSAGRLAGRLSQPRQGHQDHPQRGRAQARPDQDLQAHRRSGRRHPQHAAAQLAQARRDGDQDREQGSGCREGRGREADPLREGAVEDGRRSGQAGPRDIRQEDQARQAPHRFRRGARARRGRDRRGHGGARADHHRGVGEGLDPRAARPSGRHLRDRVQDRRRAEVCLPGGDHVEDSGVRHQRPLLHHRRLEAAGRPRPRRAGAALRRHGAGRRSRFRVPLSGRPQVPGGEQDRPRLRGGRGRSASPTPARASRCSTSSRRTRRARSRRSRARWRRRSARTARW